MDQIELKYGCNPNQIPARIYTDNVPLPVTVLNGRPGYINFLDALNAWQLVRELKAATGMAAATSFKHVSPAGAAVGTPLDEDMMRSCFIEDNINDSAIACAYARARGADRMSSFGDWAALSDECDETTARLLAKEVSDGVIAPSFTPKALEILSAKRKGGYNVVSIDPNYEPEAIEHKQVFGVTFEQKRNDIVIDDSLFTNIPTRNAQLSDAQKRDLIIALITLKYTQSNSVCYTKDGQATGVGAGQQSRIHCTRLAGDKSDLWHLRRHPRVLDLPFREDLSRPDRDNAIDIYLSADSDSLLDDWERVFTQKPEPFTSEEKQQFIASITGVALGSDAFFPFGDNIERAHRSGVTAIAQPGGSIRDDNVISMCDEYGIVMACTGIRLFHH